LSAAAWNAAPADASENVVRDAFGHAVTYHADDTARDGAYTLRSLGLDGVTSGDDLCVVGRSAQLAGAAHDPLRFVEDLRADRLGWSSQLGALARARCSLGRP
jgi:hypothetical protein